MLLFRRRVPHKVTAVRSVRPERHRGDVTLDDSGLARQAYDLGIRFGVTVGLCGEILGLLLGLSGLWIKVVVRLLRSELVGYRVGYG